MSLESKLLGLLADVVPTGSRLSDTIELKVSTLRTLLRDAAEIEREGCLEAAELTSDGFRVKQRIIEAIVSRGDR